MTRISSLAITGLAALIGSVGFVANAQAGDTEFYDSEVGQPYGFAPGQENATMDPSYRDHSGNRTMSTAYADGLSASSPNYAQVDSYSSNSGVQSASVGGYAGNGQYGSATAIGNNLTVITTGSYNTVLVNATQINNGNQTANTSLNGDAND